MLLDTGIRVSELCGLTLDDVHEGYFKVLGKGRKEREVGVSPTTAKFLWKYIHQYRPESDDNVRALFTNITGKPLTPWASSRCCSGCGRRHVFGTENWPHL